MAPKNPRSVPLRVASDELFMTEADARSGKPGDPAKSASHYWREFPQAVERKWWHRKKWQLNKKECGEIREMNWWLFYDPSRRHLWYEVSWYPYSIKGSTNYFALWEAYWGYSRFTVKIYDTGGGVDRLLLSETIDDYIDCKDKGRRFVVNTKDLPYNIARYWSDLRMDIPRWEVKYKLNC